MNSVLFVSLSVLAALVGAVVAFYYGRSLARRYGDMLVPSDVSQQVLRNAMWRKEMAIKTARETTREHLEQETRRLEEERELARHLMEKFDKELDQRQSSLDKKTNEISKFEEKVSGKEAELQALRDKNTQIEAARLEVLEQYSQGLEAKAGVTRAELKEFIQREMVSGEQLAISKWTLDNLEEVKIDAQRWAKGKLDVIVDRYNPKFIWPKSAFSVEAKNMAVAEHFSRSGAVVAALTEGLGIDVDVLDNGESEPATIKISGGYGVEKEALRLAFSEMINRGEFGVDKALEAREKFRKQLDKLILKYGEDAEKSLGLQGIHPELLKLIGALNFRTSHRQNQYYHSFEVARLAGMLADEIGVDPLLAKRSGLLHDIGKALDYRIEGSHAVISADYAEKFGESREVIDTVLSHHDDKIVETPHAYILKAADALSGARPGARVEMEEGYQKRIEAIAAVVQSFEKSGVASSVIMNAGREVHVFVDSRKVKEKDADPLALEIVRKLESDVEFPGQIRVTVVRRTEVTEVA
jgi:ribonuclease Y